MVLIVIAWARVDGVSARRLPRAARFYASLLAMRLGGCIRRASGPYSHQRFTQLHRDDRISARLLAGCKSTLRRTKSLITEKLLAVTRTLQRGLLSAFYESLIEASRCDGSVSVCFCI